MRLFFDFYFAVQTDLKTQHRVLQNLNLLSSFLFDFFKGDCQYAVF